MKIIKELVEEIREELEGAEKYARMAAQMKGQDDSMAIMYADMAKQEMEHVEKLHGKAADIIKKHRAEKGEPPPAMLAVWEWEHERMIDKAAEIRVMIEMARK